MTKHCTECKQPLTFTERWGIRKHVCDEDVLAALAYKQQEEHKQYLERKRIQQERDAIMRAAIAQRQLEALQAQQAARIAPTFTPVRSSVRPSGSSQRVSSSYDDDSVVTSFAYSSPSYSNDSSSSYSSSCDSSSSSDGGSCSSGD